MLMCELGSKDWDSLPKFIKRSGEMVFAITTRPVYLFLYNNKYVKFRRHAFNDSRIFEENLHCKTAFVIDDKLNNKLLLIFNHLNL